MIVLPPCESMRRCLYYPISFTMAKNSVRVMSWNVDMDTKPIVPRMISLIRQIRRFTPDVVCLQELTKETHLLISNALCKPAALKDEKKTQNDTVTGGGSSQPPSSSDSSNTSDEDRPNDNSSNMERQAEIKNSLQYVIHCPSEWVTGLPYFCAMLTRKNMFSGEVEFEATRFRSSSMFRGYIQVCGTLRNGMKVSLVTSHLESLQTSSAQRKLQLTDILELQRREVEDGALTIFAGDTNLRESEVPARQIQKVIKKSGTEAPARKIKRARVEQKFQDAYLLSDQDDSHKYTWEMTKNDNLSDFGEFKPRTRYDRAFLLAPSSTNLTVPHFQLIGKERLGCGKFISDHWGLLFTAQCECHS